MPNSSLEHEERHIFEQRRGNEGQEEFHFFEGNRENSGINLGPEEQRLLDEALATIGNLNLHNSNFQSVAPPPTRYEMLCDNVQEALEDLRNPCESISIAMRQTRDRLIDLGNQVTALMGCGFFSAEQSESDGEQNEPLIIGDVRNSA